METIMLTGKSGKGKTAVLFFVHEILVAAGAVLNKVEHVGAKNQRDFKSSLTYQGKKIVLLTMGDEEPDIENALNDKNSDFLICACNDDHNKFFQQATHRFEKTTADSLSSRIAANWYDANRIVEQLEKSIS